MPILIDQLNVNTRVRTNGDDNNKRQPPPPPTDTVTPPAVVLALLELALDSKRW